MSGTELFDLSGSATSRRAVLRATLGGLVALGIGACGGGGSTDSDATDVGSSDPDLAGRALAGAPVEVWRDPG